MVKNKQGNITMTKEQKDYTDNHDGEFPEWLNKLIEERYGFTPYKL